MTSVRLAKRPASVAAFLFLALLVYTTAISLYKYIASTDRHKTTDNARSEPNTEPSEMQANDPHRGFGVATSETTTDRSKSAHSMMEPQLESKVIVIGRLQREETGWVHEHLSDWQNAIYTVDNATYPLSASRNKGREANAYLLYIIQHYDRLPAVIAFLHPHRNGYPGGWHTDVAGHDNVLAMQTLRLDFVRDSGFVNLRCNWTPGCPDEIRPLFDADVDNVTTVQTQMPLVWHHFFGKLSVLPEVIATPCCAQFAVSRQQVLKRPLEDYQRYHEWLMNTRLSDDVSGRILEYLWHIIFGMRPVQYVATFAGPSEANSRGQLPRYEPMLPERIRSAMSFDINWSWGL